MQFIFFRKRLMSFPKENELHGCVIFLLAASCSFVTTPTIDQWSVYPSDLVPNTLVVYPT